jgi:membrane protein implicated in regulation of membrane protease activity
MQGFDFVIHPEMFDNPMEGVSETVISGQLPGRIKVMGVSWEARLCVPDPRCKIVAGKPVIVIGRRGNTLLILPQRG